MAFTLRVELSIACVCRPVRNALLFPKGAPDPLPPCIRHRPFPLTAGDSHAVPLRVFAPQRGAEASPSRLRLWSPDTYSLPAMAARSPVYASGFRIIVTSIDVTNNCLTTFSHLYALNDDLLTRFASTPI